MDELIEMLRRHEGVRDKVYLCSEGYETIGVGRNISADGLGLSDDEINYLLENDIERVRKELAEEYYWFAGLNDARQDASMELTGLPPLATWTGGTIPFMAMMQGKYPEAMFLCTGSSGPGNNAHGPDEKLHIPSSKRLTVALSATISAICGNS